MSISPSALWALGVKAPYDAADRTSQSNAKWIVSPGSADADLLAGKPQIDWRARDLIRNDAYIQGGANLHRDNIVGSNFMLNARPTSALIKGADEVWEQEFQEEVEALWDVYADSPRHWVDASRQADFTGLVRLAVGIHFFAGEVLSTVEWLEGDNPDFNTAIQMIDLDRLSTDPTQALNQQYLRSGVLMDQYGAPQAYQIRSQHPFDYPLWNADVPFWKTIPIRKPWGRLQVIHLYEKVRPAQTRGVTDLAAAMVETRMTHRSREARLQREIVQSLYAAVLTSDLDTQTVMAQIGQGGDEERVAETIGAMAGGYLESVADYVGKTGRLRLDGVRIPHLYPGTQLDIKTGGDSAQATQALEASLLRYIAASAGVSYEQLSRDYTNTNYSSARASLAETLKFMSARKKLIADRFASSIYMLWLEEAINKNYLSTFPAKRATELYTNGLQNRVFEALARAEWIGASQGQIDQLKETQAAVMRLNGGLSTLEDEHARLGKDWRRVLRQRKRELDMQNLLGLSFPATGNLPRGGLQPEQETNPTAPEPTPKEEGEAESDDTADNDPKDAKST